MKLSSNSLVRWSKDEMEDDFSRLYHIRAGPLWVVGKHPSVGSIVCMPVPLPARVVGPAQGSHRGWGVARRDPSDTRVSQFCGERRRVVSLFKEASERERESPRERPPLVLSEGDFIFTGEEVARTFGFTLAVTSVMAELYGEPVGAVVWGEDMM
ncbi:hypothetical protein BHE74_00034219 [Ensete ventricosum]|nr:hypothetical protein BHE74_00034219 [Ensete ventricosum]